MKYGLTGAFIKFAFAKTAFSYIEKTVPEMDMASYKKRVLKESTAVAASKFWFLETRAPLPEELLDFFEALDLDGAG